MSPISATFQAETMMRRDSGIVPYQFDCLRDLVDEAAVGLGPAAPLIAVNVVQIA